MIALKLVQKYDTQTPKTSYAQGFWPCKSFTHAEAAAISPSREVRGMAEDTWLSTIQVYLGNSEDMRVCVCVSHSWSCQKKKRERHCLYSHETHL